MSAVYVGGEGGRRKRGKKEWEGSSSGFSDGIGDY
jgi:hypothetical protein